MPIRFDEPPNRLKTRKALVTLGDIADGQYLKRDGKEIIGAEGGLGPPGPPGPPGADGTDGTNGTNGTDGTDGSAWRNGSGVPSNLLGDNGDYYLDDTTLDYYRKILGLYILQGNLSGTGSFPLLFEAENKEGSALVRGQPVATHSSGTGIVAALGLGVAKPGVGLLYEDTADTFVGRVQKDGLFILADWTPITGAATLIRGPYYLDPVTPGMLTSIAPTATGDLVQAMGYAVATDTLEVEIQPSILL